LNFFFLCGINILPEKQVMLMFEWKTIELPWLKGIEIQEHPLMAEAYAELEPEVYRRRETELAGRKGVR
jgi:hypothetical protein